MAVLGELLRAMLRFSGVKQEVLEEAVPYAQVPGIGREEAEEEVPKPNVDPDSIAGRMLQAQARREATQEP